MGSFALITMSKTVRHQVSLFLFTSILIVGSKGFAVQWGNPLQSQKGYVELADGVPHYVEYTPATQGKPTFILINGLVYDIERWNPVRNELVKKGFGVFNYYIRGQYLSLREEKNRKGEPLFFKTGLTTKQLAAELTQILAKMGLSQQKFHVVGLSFGAAVAAEWATQEPSRVEQLIFMAPMVLPLDRYNPQGQWLYNNLELIKLWWGPFLGPSFYEYAYNSIYKSYLKQRIVPDRVPDVLKDMPEVHQEAVFHLVRATRYFDLRQYSFANICRGCVHFLLAQEDKEVFQDQLKAFEMVSSQARGSLVFVAEAEHAIPDTAPEAGVYLLEQLFYQKKGFQSPFAPGQKYKLSNGRLSPLP